VVVPIGFGQTIFDEGSFVQASCMVTKGDEPLKITWSFHGARINSEPGISTQNLGARTSILMIASVNHKHNGNYTCKVSNAAGSVSSTTHLRVNGIKSFGKERERSKGGTLKQRFKVLNILVSQNHPKCCHLASVQLFWVRVHLLNFPVWSRRGMNLFLFRGLCMVMTCHQTLALSLPTLAQESAP